MDAAKFLYHDIIDLQQLLRNSKGMAKTKLAGIIFLKNLML